LPDRKSRARSTRSTVRSIRARRSSSARRSYAGLGCDTAQGGYTGADDDATPSLAELTVKPLAIFGAGGHAREVIALVRDLNAARPQDGWDLLGVLSDRGEWTLPETVGVPRLGGLDWLIKRPDCSVSIAIGDPAVREDVAKRIRAVCTNSFATLVHPRAWIAERVTLGEGTQVCAGAMLNADVSIGAHVILNIGCSVSHDSVIADFATLAPGVTLCGGVRIGRGCDLGACAVVLPRIEIGSAARVGAGAVAATSVAPGTTVAGVPARPQ
jgi:sugar O-acyltransferase (sialic acid O-acetyltransferase NeuD family)